MSVTQNMAFRNGCSAPILQILLMLKISRNALITVDALAAAVDFFARS